MRTIPEIRRIMLDCLNVDDLEGSKMKLQIILTPEEQRAMIAFQKEYSTKISTVNKEYALGMITEEDKNERLAALEKNHLEFLGEA